MITSPLFDDIRSYFLRSNKDEQIFLFVPYIKTKILEKLVDGLENKITIITTWHIDDLLKGSSELELYNFCKKNQISLFINNQIHLKVYSLNLNTGIIASGNISKRGLHEGGNYEAAILSGKFTIKDRMYLEKIKQESIFVTDAIFAEYQNRFNECEKIAPPQKTFDDPKIQTKKDDFLISALPMTRTVEQLLAGYERINQNKKPSDSDEISNCVYHDINNYSIPFGLSNDEFYEKLKNAFFSHPFTLKIAKFINPEAQFGQIKQWIQENCTNVPIPSRRELTANVQVLFDWFVTLDGQKYGRDIPGRHSERIFLRGKLNESKKYSDSKLKYEDQVLQILSEPGFTIDQIRKRKRVFFSSESQIIIHDTSNPVNEKFANEKVWHYIDNTCHEIEKRLKLNDVEVGKRNSKGRFYKEIVAVIGKLYAENKIEFWYRKGTGTGTNSDGIWRLK